jgi:hypothetical protein
LARSALIVIILSKATAGVDRIDSLPSFLTVKRIPGESVSPCVVSRKDAKIRRGTCMPNDVTEIENEQRSVAQVKCQVEEQIGALQQRLHDDEIWLELNPPVTVEYQETWEEVRALPVYIAELHAQAMSLADVLLDLTLERKRWDNPDWLLAS